MRIARALDRLVAGWPVGGWVVVDVDDPAFAAGVEPGAGVPCASAEAGSAKASSREATSAARLSATLSPGPDSRSHLRPGLHRLRVRIAVDTEVLEHQR